MEGVEESVSINHVTDVTNYGNAPDQQLTRIVEPELTNRQPRKVLWNDKEMEQKTIERIVHYVVIKSGLQYLGAWFGYSSTGDTVKPPNYLPKHLIFT